MSHSDAGEFTVVPLTFFQLNTPLQIIRSSAKRSLVDHIFRLRSFIEMGSVQKIRILVVDDDEMQLSLISRWLQKLSSENIDVMSTSNVNEAIGRAIAGEFDICLTDLDMPESNGIKLLKAIKSTDPLTPVILMTGISNRNALESSLSFGADDYFLKPLSWEDLLGSVRFQIARLKRFRSDFPMQNDSKRTAVI